MDILRKLEQNPADNRGGIPRLIHWIWIGKNKKPRDYSLYTASFSHILRDHRPVFWDGHDCTAFLRRFYPAFLRCYNALSSAAAKSDLMRYLILSRYGGIYVDYDLVLLDGNLLKKYLASGHSCILVAETVIDEKFRAATSRIKIRERIPEDKVRVANFFMGARPGHPLIGRIIQEVAGRSARLRYRIRAPYDVIYMTGPDVVSTVYHRGSDGAFLISLVDARRMLFHQGDGKSNGWKQIDRPRAINRRKRR